MIEKQIILVTGAANGIGRSISEQLLLEGHTLIIVDNDSNGLTIFEEDLKHNLKLSNSMFHTKLCNVADSQAVIKLIDSLKSQNIMPNVLINNAGYGGPFQLLSEVSDFEWDKVIGTNLKGIFNFSREILPFMKLNGSGKIINIASIQGLTGACLSSTYIATKHGVVGYTKAIAAEWGPFGITCNAICPGYVNTAKGSQDSQVPDHYKKIIGRTPLGRVANPIDIAYLVEFLISSKADFINGSIITIDGGLTADIGIS